MKKSIMFNSTQFISERKAIRKRKEIIKKTILFSIVFFICIGVGIKVSKALVNASDSKVEQQLLNYEKVKVSVEKGDTLWNLQKKVTPNEDIREMLFLAEKNAGHSLDSIHPGDEIVLLKK